MSAVIMIGGSQDFFIRSYPESNGDVPEDRGFEPRAIPLCDTSTPTPGIAFVSLGHSERGINSLKKDCFATSFKPKGSYSCFEQRPHQESNLDAPRGLDFKSSAIPLCDVGFSVNFRGRRFLSLMTEHIKI